VTTSDKKYVGVARKSTQSPRLSITLQDPVYEYLTKTMMNGDVYIPLREEDTWKYLSEESTSFQKEVEKVYDSYYENVMKEIKKDANGDPHLAKRLLHFVPKKYIDQAKNRANLNLTLKPVLGDPASVVSKFLGGSKTKKYRRKSCQPVN